MREIRVDHVSKSFGKAKALDDVSLSFELGRNGAGKSTLLGLIANRLVPTSGRIFVDGEPAADNARALAKLYCMNDKKMYPENLRLDNLFKEMGRFYEGFDRTAAAGFAEAFGLDLRKKIGSLSTGYRSIYQLVVGLSLDVDYLLLDEPVLGLDANHRELFYKLLLDDYLEKQRTVIIATHLIEEVANLVEQVTIVDRGRVLLASSAEELLQRVGAHGGRGRLLRGDGGARRGGAGRLERGVRAGQARRGAPERAAGRRAAQPAEAVRETDREGGSAMRKFKAIVRYQMADILFSMSVFFIVFAVCFGLGWAIIAFAGEGGTPFKGMYLWMCVFLGLCGGISYSIDFKFALQCGVTRAQAYLSTALSFGVVALVFALVDQLLLAVLPLWGEQSIVALYGEGYGPGLLGFAWTLAFNLAIVFLSYALVVLHGRVGKAPFLLGLLAFGLLAFVLVPTVFQVVPGAADAAGAVLLPALGFTAQGIVLANPIVLFAVVAVLSALAAYLLTRRAEVR